MEKMQADMKLMMALKELAEALKMAEEEAKKMKEEGEEEEEMEEPGPCAGYNPADCKCPGRCEKEGRECLWCMWVPWPPPGQKGRTAGYAPPSMLGLMPPDTGIMSVMGFPFFAAMREEPNAPQPVLPPIRGIPDVAPDPSPSSGTVIGGTNPCPDLDKAVQQQIANARKALFKRINDDPVKEGSGAWGAVPVTIKGATTFVLVSDAAKGAKAVGMKTAAGNMTHYLDNGGRDRNINVDGIVNNNRHMKDAVDGLVSDSFARIDGQARSKGGDFVFVSDPRMVRFGKGGVGEYSDSDMRLAYGALSIVMVACVMKCGRGRVVTYKIVAYDRYNWDSTKTTNILGITVSDKTLALLHRQGLAMEYNLFGASAEVVMVLCPDDRSRVNDPPTGTGGRAGTGGR